MSVNLVLGLLLTGAGVYGLYDTLRGVRIKLKYVNGTLTEEEYNRFRVLGPGSFLTKRFLKYKF